MTYVIFWIYGYDRMKCSFPVRSDFKTPSPRSKERDIASIIYKTKM
jgi:hypothetical protein